MVRVQRLIPGGELIDIRKIAVIGAGEMGQGIAELFAMDKYEVTLIATTAEKFNSVISKIEGDIRRSVEKGRLKSEDIPAILGNIKKETAIRDGVKDAQLIIEAIPEILDLKCRLFRDLEGYTAGILASNTSNISITDIAKDVRSKDRVAGLHFFNPPVKMKLVEVIAGEHTSEDTINTLMDVAKTIGKTPVKVRRDRPGFIVNRINAPDMLYLGLVIEKGIAEPEEVDAFARSQGLVMGPYELMDFVGIDTVDHSMNYYKEKLSADYGKCTVYGKMVSENRLGRKSGKGFYDWSSGRPKIDLSRASEKIALMDIFAIEINEAVKLIEEGVAAPDDVDTAVMLGMNRPFGPISVAKSFTNAEIRSQLEELVKSFDNSVFEPADSIKAGKMRDIIYGRIAMGAHIVE